MQGSNRFDTQPGSGFRSNAADFGSSASPTDRGGFGSDGHEPHSSAGFRRALMHAGRSSNRILGMPDKTSFGGRGFRKPNYFAQGGARHGLHISTGAPHTAGTAQEGADFGGN